MLADGPELAPAAIERVVAAWRESGAPLVAASYGGVRGHPAARRPFGLGGHPGRRACARYEPLLVPCDDLGAPGDVDYPDDLPERFRTARRRTEVGQMELVHRSRTRPARPRPLPTGARSRPRACTGS